MYEITPGWEPYYETLETEERKEIFQKLIKELPDDGANAMRRKLFENRYPSDKRSSVQDKYLMWILFFPGLYEKRASFFTNMEKEMNKVCESLCLTDVEHCSDIEKAALYLEFRNAADLYFWTCKDGSYGRKLFGFVMSDGEGKLEKACQEAWIASVGIIQAGNKEEQMQIFSQAVKDSFFQFDKKAKNVFETFAEEQNKILLKRRKR